MFTHLRLQAQTPRSESEKLIKLKIMQQQAGHSWASTTATYTTVGQDARNRMLRAALALAGRLAAELIARGSTALILPACALCGRTGKPLFRSTDGGVCQRCRNWQLAAACAICGKVKPVSGRDADGKPVCEVCRRRGPARHRPCGNCGKTAPVADRGRGGKPDICVNCYRLPAAACSACGRIRP